LGEQRIAEPEFERHFFFCVAVGVEADNVLRTDELIPSREIADAY
jgi:hypothetical protein